MSDKIHIMMIEDNPGDVELTRIHLDEAKVLHRLDTFDNGIDGLKFLRAEPPFQARTLPDLLLLDLNLPGMSGHDILKILKADPKLKQIPVVVLTSSQAESDIAASYELHANAFVTKPVDLEQFGKIIRGIESFWLSVVRLPHIKE